jgi:hypothetical protein
MLVWLLKKATGHFSSQKSIQDLLSPSESISVMDQSILMEINDEIYPIHQSLTVNPLFLLGKKQVRFAIRHIHRLSWDIFQ